MSLFQSVLESMIRIHDGDDEVDQVLAEIETKYPIGSPTMLVDGHVFLSTVALNAIVRTS